MYGLLKSHIPQYRRRNYQSNLPVGLLFLPLSVAYFPSSIVAHAYGYNTKYVTVHM